MFFDKILSFVYVISTDYKLEGGVNVTSISNDERLSAGHGITSMLDFGC
jgi:hypothetical protein